jgi:hypothetical protein
MLHLPGVTIPSTPGINKLKNKVGSTGQLLDKNTIKNSFYELKGK